jgi:transposase
MIITQNDKIRQITEKTMIVGVDIASETHYARMFDWRGIELGKVFSFENSAEGFESFSRRIAEMSAKEGKNNVIIGAEPTGHYWFALAAYLEKNGVKLVLVNPYHVKRTKELDDGHPSKSDRKDPKTIAKLVIEGRYSEPYIPEGVYAELRVAMNCRWRLLKEITAVKNRIQRWLKIYFPEYRTVFSEFGGMGSLAILREAPLPADVLLMGADAINDIWRRIKLRSVGIKRAKKLCEAAENSVGCAEGAVAARLELKFLLDDYETKIKQLEAVMAVVEALCGQLPEVAAFMKMRGIGLAAAAGFIAETGDLRRFDSPRQIQKLAGLAIRENSSGKQRGQTTISKRGRARLRAILFRAAISLAATNPEFRSLHNYFTTRAKNPLKKKQSIIALSCKLIRVFYVLAATKREYDPVKLLADIHRNTPPDAA